MLHIGTLNVHEWFNELNQYSFDRLTTILKQSDLDVVGLQETDEKQVKKVITKLPNYNYIYQRYI